MIEFINFCLSSCFNYNIEERFRRVSEKVFKKKIGRKNIAKDVFSLPTGGKIQKYIWLLL